MFKTNKSRISNQQTIQPKTKTITGQTKKGGEDGLNALGNETEDKDRNAEIFRLKSDLDDTTNRWITREEKFRKKVLELEIETRKLRNAARKESIKVEDDELDK